MEPSTGRFLWGNGVQIVRGMGQLSGLPDRLIGIGLLMAVVLTGCSGADPVGVVDPSETRDEAGPSVPVIEAFAARDDGPVRAVADAGGTDMGRLLQALPQDLPVTVVNRGAALRAVDASIGADSPHDDWERAVVAAQSAGVYNCWTTWPSCAMRDTETAVGWQVRFGFPLSAIELSATVGWADDEAYVVAGDFEETEVRSAFLADPDRGADLLEVAVPGLGPDTTVFTWDTTCQLDDATQPDRPQGCPGTAFVADGILAFSPGESLVSAGGDLHSSAFADVLATGFGRTGLIDTPGIAAVLDGVPDDIVSLLIVPQDVRMAPVPDSIREDLSTLPSLPAPRLHVSLRDTGGIEHLALLYPDGTDLAALVDPLTTILTSDGVRDVGVRIPPEETLDVRVHEPVLFASVASRSDIFGDLLLNVAPLVLYGIQ